VLEFDTFDDDVNGGPGWFVDDIYVTGHLPAPVAVGGTVVEPSPTTGLLALQNLFSETADLDCPHANSLALE
jgi:hypothetical protein